MQICHHHRPVLTTECHWVAPGLCMETHNPLTCLVGSPAERSVLVNVPVQFLFTLSHIFYKMKLRLRHSSGEHSMGGYLRPSHPSLPPDTLPLRGIPPFPRLSHAAPCLLVLSVQNQTLLTQSPWEFTQNTDWPAHLWAYPHWAEPV